MNIKPEDLIYNRKNVWKQVNAETAQQIFNFSEGYKQFISNSKTERACVSQIINMAQIRGFIPIQQCQALKPGDKVIISSKGKVVALAVIGQQGLDRGLSLIGSHTDAPRLDLKPHPLFQDQELALFKTHYYGGIKKYQWLAVPLALHGVIYKSDGQVVDISIGEEPNDPIFTISDLLPHLAKDQMVKKLTEAVEGEQLNILIGGVSLPGGGKDNSVKLNILKLLYETYGITEEDFVSAELELVPAGPARDLGLDRSMIGAYGQDDRVCVYTSLQAILEINNPNRTAVALFVDKEEVGSNGNTGMMGRFLQNTISEMGMRLYPAFNEFALYRVFEKSIALSADVTAAMDPNYEGVLEKMNAARLGGGVALTKYTGVKGKYHTNDANAEYVAFIRKMLNQHDIIWQTGELGKVDQGGGGTIAYIIAELGFEVIDCGVPLLSMHSPLEIASKADVFECYRTYKNFFMV
ncbi:aminopeptidase [Desulfotomaculum sp. 1211_IL3151]|uniref:aminopeptidase n=1 Tax=Desulfotomaculum sp. 1211_IL3151 TaxID=3084055 RepID=UPI002FDB4B88